MPDRASRSTPIRARLLYPDDPAEIVDLLSSHLVRPVEFVREITAMYEAGARIFVEVGPRSVLSGLVTRILGEQTHVAVALDQPARPGVAALLQGLAALVAEGVPVKIEHLFAGRSVRRLDLAALGRETGVARYSPTTWMISGGRARPALIQVPSSHLPAPPLRVAVIDGDTEAVARPALVGAAMGVNQRPSMVQSAAATAAVERNTASVQTGTAMIVDNTMPQKENGASAQAPTVRHSLPTASPVPMGGTTYQAQPAALGSGAGEVMLEFQKVMQRFLETQNNVMLAYLQARPAAPTIVSTPLEARQITPAALAPVPAAIASGAPALPFASNVLAAPQAHTGSKRDQRRDTSSRNKWDQWRGPSRNQRDQWRGTS